MSRSRFGGALSAALVVSLLLGAVFSPANPFTQLLSAGPTFPVILYSRTGSPTGFTVAAGAATSSSSARRTGAVDDPITDVLTPRFATTDITAARVRTNVRTIKTKRVVDAPPEAVWAVLTDFSAYPEWNPFIPRIEGVPREGERLQVRIEPPGSRGATLRPAVQVAEPNRRFAWLGRLFVPHLFDGRHEFRLEPLDGGERTRFVQRETFGGVLVPLLLDADAVRRGFEAMNATLAERAEAAATVGR